MKKVDNYNIIGGILILIFSIIYYMDGELFKGIATTVVAMFLLVPAVIRRINNK